MMNRHKIKLVKGAVDEIIKPKQSLVRATLTMELTLKDLERMMARAGLEGDYTKEQIINAYIKAMLNK